MTASAVLIFVRKTRFVYKADILRYHKDMIISSKRLFTNLLQSYNLNNPILASIITF
jgi:hypothetical protein